MHVKSNLTREMGGLFLGHRCRESDGKMFVEVTAFSPARHGRATHVEVEITHDDVRDAIDMASHRGFNEQIVGWLHSHPNMPAAPSPRDENEPMLVFQQNPEQFTMIIDPIRDEIGVFRLRAGESINEGGFRVKGNLLGREIGVVQQLRFTQRNKFADSEDESKQR